MRRKVGVAIFVSGGREWRTRIGEDSRSIRPVEKEVQKYAEKGRCIAFDPVKS